MTWVGVGKWAQSSRLPPPSRPNRRALETLWRASFGGILLLRVWGVARVLPWVPNMRYARVRLAAASGKGSDLVTVDLRLPAPVPGTWNYDTAAVFIPSRTVRTNLLHGALDTSDGASQV